MKTITSVLHRLDELVNQAARFLEDAHWQIYYRHGWLKRFPAPPLRDWEVVLLSGAEPPAEVPGYQQRIVYVSDPLSEHG